MLLQIGEIPQFTDVQIFCTDRKSGNSTGNYESFNLGIKSGDNENMVLENRGLLAEKIGKNRDDFIYLNQIHSCDVCVLKKGETYNFDGYDALITDDAGNIPIILVADCIPIVVYDDVKKVMGVIHSGWKGTAKNILANTITAIQNNFHSEVGDIHVIIGPCISSKNYEVDDIVVSNFSDNFYSKNTDGGYQIDLRAIVESQAKNVGIIESNIYHIDMCTFEREDLFFSARRDGYESGRFAMGIYFK